MRELTLRTSSRTDFVDVTGLVSRAVGDLDLVDGAVVVFNPHTTAGITINEGADPDVVHDMSAQFEAMVPWENNYRHAEGNAAAHVKATLCGSSVTVIVRGGQLQLGTWQKIWFCDFDGPRQRRVWLTGLAGQEGPAG